MIAPPSIRSLSLGMFLSSQIRCKDTPFTNHIVLYPFLGLVYGLQFPAMISISLTQSHALHFFHLSPFHVSLHASCQVSPPPKSQIFQVFLSDISFYHYVVNLSHHFVFSLIPIQSNPSFLFLCIAFFSTPA